MKRKFKIFTWLALVLCLSSLNACTIKTASISLASVSSTASEENSLMTLDDIYEENIFNKASQQLIKNIKAEQQHNVKVSLYISPIAPKRYTTSNERLHNTKNKIQLHENDIMNPASTMKLLTTASAFALLDITYQAQTSLWINPQIKTNRSDVLQGPLYIKGQASSSFDRGQLSLLLEQLWLRGYRHIPDGLVFDRAFFQPTRADLTAPSFDETPLALYNLIPDSLLFEEGIQRINLKSDERSLSIGLSPVLHQIIIDTTQVEFTGKCGQWRYPGNLNWEWRFNDKRNSSINSGNDSTSDNKASLIVSGRFPANCQQQVYAPWFDRDDQLALMIQQTWRQLGGTMGPDSEPRKTFQLSRSGTVPASAKKIAALPSIALTEWVRRINKYSDNPLARSLFLTLGQSCDSDLKEHTISNAPNEALLSSNRCAQARIHQYLSAQGINSEGIVLENGSGLSRQERISAKQLADVIQMAYQHHTGHEFVASLPIAGMDGTMKRRLSQACLSGRLRLKTGSLRDVTSIAGLYLAKSGTPQVIVIMINGNLSNTRARQMIDSWLWQYLSAITPECRISSS